MWIFVFALSAAVSIYACALTYYMLVNRSNDSHKRK